MVVRAPPQSFLREPFDGNPPKGSHMCCLHVLRSIFVNLEQSSGSPDQSGYVV